MPQVQPRVGIPGGSVTKTLGRATRRSPGGAAATTRCRATAGRWVVSAYQRRCERSARDIDRQPPPAGQRQVEAGLLSDRARRSG